MKDIKWNKTNFKNPIAIACGTTETEDGNGLLCHFKLLPVKKTFWQKIWEKLFKKQSDWKEWDYVSLDFKGYANKSRTTHIKLPAPTPLPNNNIKIEIYETKR
jgi:hypothetical protein